MKSPKLTPHFVTALLLCVLSLIDTCFTSGDVVFLVQWSGSFLWLSEGRSDPWDKQAAVAIFASSFLSVKAEERESHKPEDGNGSKKMEEEGEKQVEWFSYYMVQEEDKRSASVLDMYTLVQLCPKPLELSDFQNKVEKKYIRKRKLFCVFTWTLGRLYIEEFNTVRVGVRNNKY